MDKTNELQQIFNENKQLYLWLIEYGISHEYLNFALHKGVFPKRFEVKCSGFKYFSGKLKGGPYSLNILRKQGNEHEIIEIRGNTSDLVIKCEFINEITSIHGGF